MSKSNVKSREWPKPRVIWVSAQQRRKWECHPFAQAALQFYQANYSHSRADIRTAGQLSRSTYRTPVPLIRVDKNGALDHYQFFGSFPAIEVLAEDAEGRVLGFVWSDLERQQIETLAWESVAEALYQSVGRNGHWLAWSSFRELMSPEASMAVFGEQPLTLETMAKILNVKAKHINYQRDCIKKAAGRLAGYSKAKSKKVLL